MFPLQRPGENKITDTAVFQLEFFLDFFRLQRMIFRNDIKLFLLFNGARVHSLYFQYPSGKVIYLSVRSIKVGIGMQFFQSESLRDQMKSTGL